MEEYKFEPLRQHQWALDLEDKSPDLDYVHLSVVSAYSDLHALIISLRCWVDKPSPARQLLEHQRNRVREIRLVVFGAVPIIGQEHTYDATTGTTSGYRHRKQSVLVSYSHATLLPFDLRMDSSDQMLERVAFLDPIYTFDSDWVDMEW
jgi:hypothetical protein